MIEQEILLYKELASFCNANKEQIETKFDRSVIFTDFNETCYREMYWNCRNIKEPKPVKELKELVPGLDEAYKKWSPYYLRQRNSFNKNMDIQLGQWYEKALQLFLASRGITVTKRGFPYPDYEVSVDGKPIAYYELKYIESPFLYANRKIEDPYPYTTSRYDYEASLTLDTGKKIFRQGEKMEELIEQGFPVHFIWWFDCFHIKGLFAYSAKEVYSYYNTIGANQLVRKQRAGDKEAHQEIGKIYPPLLEMIPLGEYITLIS